MVPCVAEQIWLVTCSTTETYKLYYLIEIFTHTHRQSARETANHTKHGPTKREKTPEIFASMAKYMVIRCANKMSTRTTIA